MHSAYNEPADVEMRMRNAAGRQSANPSFQGSLLKALYHKHVDVAHFSHSQGTT